MKHIISNRYSELEETHDSSEMKRRTFSVIYFAFMKHVTHIVTIPSPKLTVHPRKRSFPKGKDRLPIIHFQVPAVSFREGESFFGLVSKLWALFWYLDVPGS